MRVECGRRGLWLWQCHHCLTLKWALPSPGSAFGVGSACKEMGGCLAAGAYQTTGKCQCLRGHLSPAPNSQPPSARHRRARRCSTAQGRGAWLGGASCFPFCLCVVPCFSKVLVLWCFQVCGKFAGCCQRAFWWGAVGGKGACVGACVHSCRLFARLWTLVRAWLPLPFSLL